jgi:hypothetical protein
MHHRLQAELAAAARNNRSAGVEIQVDIRCLTGLDGKVPPQDLLGRQLDAGCGFAR